jgi:death on curing protein
MERKIFKTGNSLVISLPRESLLNLGLQEGSEVQVTVDEESGRIIIEPLRASLADIDPPLPGSWMISLTGTGLRSKPWLNDRLPERAADSLHSRAPDRGHRRRARRVLDLGLLQAAVARPQATFDGVDLYAELFEKAAALMESLGQNHPFVDGNKRTAITAAALFLLQNDRRLQTTNEELERVTLWVVNERPPLEEIAAWFENHTIDVAG